MPRHFNMKWFYSDFKKQVTLFRSPQKLDYDLGIIFNVSRTNFTSFGFFWNMMKQTEQELKVQIQLSSFVLSVIKYLNCWDGYNKTVSILSLRSCKTNVKNSHIFISHDQFNTSRVSNLYLNWKQWDIQHSGRRYFLTRKKRYVLHRFSPYPVT